MQGPKPPDYVIPTREIGAVIYQDKEAVGLQFVDPNGDQVFISIPGSVVPKLGQALLDLALHMPAILQWPPKS